MLAPRIVPWVRLPQKQPGVIMGSEQNHSKAQPQAGAYQQKSPGGPDSLDQQPTLPGAGRHGASYRTGEESPPYHGDVGAGWLDSQPSLRLADRYEFQERLGGGGVGEVWRGLDRRLQRPVAIKRLRGELVGSRTAIERFLTEARAVARLNHPHIVQVYDFGFDREGPMLVMELVEGESLAARLGRTGPVSPEAALRLISPVCEALGAAHSQGIVHRDIKPANILLTAHGAAKLTDFGLARLETSDQGHTQFGATLGTPDFMAPEQRADPRQADARSDLWSLAATLYQMLTVHGPRVIRSDRIPEPVRPVLLRALSEDPDERYQTLGEFRAALAEACQASSVSAKTPEDLASAPVPAGPAIAAEESQKADSRLPYGRIAAVIALLWLALIGVLMFLGGLGDFAGRTPAGPRPTDRPAEVPGGGDVNPAQNAPYPSRSPRGEPRP